MVTEKQSRQPINNYRLPVHAENLQNKTNQLSNSYLLSCIVQRMFIGGQEYVSDMFFLSKHEKEIMDKLQNDSVFLETLRQILDDKESEPIKDPLEFAKSKIQKIIAGFCSKDRHFYSIDAVTDAVMKKIIKDSGKVQGKGNLDRPPIYPGKAAKGSPVLTRTFIADGSLSHSLHHYIPYPVLRKEAGTLIEDLRTQSVELEKLKKQRKDMVDSQKSGPQVKGKESKKSETDKLVKLQEQIRTLQEEFYKNKRAYDKLTVTRNELAAYGVVEEKAEVHAWQPENLVYGPAGADRIYDPGSHVDYEAGLILSAQPSDFMSFELEKPSGKKKKNRKFLKKRKEHLVINIHTETSESYMRTDLLEQIYEACFVVMDKDVPESRDFNQLLTLVRGCIPRFANIEVEKKIFVPYLIHCLEVLMQEKLPAAKKVDSVKYLATMIEQKSAIPITPSKLIAPVPSPQFFGKQKSAPKTTVTLDDVDYTVEQTPGDGDCFFHAYRALSGDTRKIDILRSLLPAGYAARQPGVWVNDMDIYQFAQATGIQIHMYTQRKNQIYPAGVYGSGGAVYRILHVNGNHFVALKPVV